MYFKKHSEIIYKAAQPVTGYVLDRKSWDKIEKTCLTELCQSVKGQALEKYYKLWMFLKREYFPLNKSRSNNLKKRLILGIHK